MALLTQNSPFKLTAQTLNRAVLSAVLSVVLDLSPSWAAFKPLQIEEMTPCNISLSQISNIPYQCWRFKHRDAKLSVWEESIGFAFGQLQKSQWQQIAQAYGNEQAILPFNPNKNYWLMDFMPPLMQAMNQHRFESESLPAPQALSPSDNTTILANCWGTLYELLRLKHQPKASETYLMMVDPDIMLDTLQSFSEPVTQPQPGDFLLITHRHSDPSQIPEGQRTYFDHGALYVDKNLLFEKAGAGDAVPYRLIDRQTIERIWRPDVFEHQVHRPKHQHQLPHPLSFRVPLPQVQNQQHHWTLIRHDNDQPPHKQVYTMFPLPALSQVKGRFILPPQTYTSDYYQNTQPNPTPKDPPEIFSSDFKGGKDHEN